jgi:hypothetical protein
MKNLKAKVLSFAAPTDADIAAFESLTDAEKRELLRAEIEKGLSGAPRKVTAEDIIAAPAK